MRRKRMKNPAFVILAILLFGTILSGIPVCAADGEFVISNGILSDYNGPGGNITIPSGVKTIKKSAFAGNKKITGVVIADTVQSLEALAFEDCINLAEVTIPYSVEATNDIDLVFNRCTGLKSINVDPKNPNYSSVDGVLYSKTKNEIILCPNQKSGSFSIPNTVTNVRDKAFSGCEKLTEIKIPSSVESLQGSAFGGCTGLKSISIPNRVTLINEAAFAGCTGLASVSIPDSVTTIRPGAFEYCSGLTEVKLPKGITELADMVFDSCTSLKKVTVPDEVTKIGKGTFGKCTSLTDATIPASVTTIDQQAFLGSKNVTISGYDNTEAQTFAQKHSIPFKSLGAAPPAGAKTAESSAAQSGTLGKASTGDFVVDEGILSKYQGHDENVVIPDGVKYIDESAFAGLANLKSVTVPKSVTYIADGTFKDSKGVTLQGYEESEAQSFARKNNIPFKALQAASSGWLPYVLVPVILIAGAVAVFFLRRQKVK